MFLALVAPRQATHRPGARRAAFLFFSSPSLSLSTRGSRLEMDRSPGGTESKHPVDSEMWQNGLGAGRARDGRAVVCGYHARVVSSVVEGAMAPRAGYVWAGIFGRVQCGTNGLRPSY